MPSFHRIFGWFVLMGFVLGACAPLNALPAENAAITSEHAVTPPGTLTAAEMSENPITDRSPTALDVMTVDELQARTYGGELEAGESLGTGAGFTRTAFWYTSDGVRVAGYASVPDGEGLFPVIILLHGFSENYRNYGLLNYTQLYTDSLTEAGFLVLHPNLRSFAPSEEGPNPLCTGFVVDVLNLIAIVQDQAGRPGLLETADPERLGLWGHSMGGGIAQRVMVSSPAVDAVVVYASMPSDERVNVEQVYPTFGQDLCQAAGLELTEEDFARISAIDNLARSEAAVYVAHGEADPVVPGFVSRELCHRLEVADRTFECRDYPNQGHEFTGEANQTFRQETIRFYREHLR